jgi:TonB family protein
MCRCGLLGLALSLLTLPGCEQACALHVETLRYPTLALAAQIQGEVQVEITTDSAGEVSSAHVVSGDPLLGKAAEENVRKWKFRPGSAMKLTIRYQFQLQDPPVLQPHTECTFDLPGTVFVVSHRLGTVDEYGAVIQPHGPGASR